MSHATDVIADRICTDTVVKNIVLQERTHHNMGSKMKSTRRGDKTLLQGHIDYFNRMLPQHFYGLVAAPSSCRLRENNIIINVVDECTTRMLTFKVSPHFLGSIDVCRAVQIRLL